MYEKEFHLSVQALRLVIKNLNVLLFPEGKSFDCVTSALHSG